MPPKNKTRSAEEVEALFTYDDDEAPAPARSAAEVESLFEYDDEPPEPEPAPEPMGPPEPPRAWYEEFGDAITDPAFYRELGKGGAAALQGASLNLADDVAGAVDPEWGQYVDQASKDYPIAHGAGQMAPGMAAAVFAGPGLAAQSLAQGGLSAASTAFDGGSLGDVAGSGLAGATAGFGGALAGRALGTAAGWATDKARKFAPSMFRDTLEGAAAEGQRRAAQLARAPRMPRPEPAPPVPEPTAPYPPAPSAAPPPAKWPPPYEPPPAPYPPARAPYPPAPSMAPASEMDDVALDAFLDEFPPVPSRAAVPIGGELGLPPYRPPGLGEGRSLGRANNGRFQQPVQASDELLDIPEALPPGRARTGLETPEPPYESPDQILLRADGPRAQPGLMPAQEPPLPMGEPPPVPRRLPNFVGEPVPFPATKELPRDPSLYPPYEMGGLETPRVAPSGMPQRRPGIAPSIAPGAAPPPPVPQKPSPLLDIAEAIPFGVGRGVRAARGAYELLGPSGGAIPRNDAAATLGRVGAEAGYEMGLPGLTGRKVNAQDREQTAYASPETTHYALSAVLSSGASGLSPADEDVITKAMVAGNDQAVRAADFRLRLQNPAYARAVERELRSYQEGDY